MSISFIISVSQIIVCSLLITTILLQQRGGGLGASFGGTGSSYFARRGMEKFLFISTIILAVIFVSLTVASLILK